MLTRPARRDKDLKLSSDGWHEGKHNPWHTINFLLYTLKQAYAEFERRAGDITSPRGEKTELVLHAVNGQTGPFRLSDIEKLCPGVGRDWIRTLLWRLGKEGKVTCTGRGTAALWRRVGK